jgi:hypothetical protein
VALLVAKLPVPHFVELLVARWYYFVASLHRFVFCQG